MVILSGVMPGCTLPLDHQGSLFSRTAPLERIDGTFAGRDAALLWKTSPGRAPDPPTRHIVQSTQVDFVWLLRRIMLIANLIGLRAVRPRERMNSPLENRKVRLRGLGGPAA
jgi:hypothetical protein